MFAIGSCTDRDKIFEFYEKDFDNERLLSDRGMLFDVLKCSGTKVKKILHVNQCNLNMRVFLIATEDSN